jgi:homospermidine synthase
LIDAMVPSQQYLTFNGRFVIVGFGSIGQGVLPLLLRHLGLTAQQITIVTAEPRGAEEAQAYGVSFHMTPLTRANYVTLLDELLQAGDFLLNVSVDVSSVALVKYCQEHGVSYLDTCIEPWPGGYTDPSLTPSERSNYGLRESALALRAARPGKAPASAPTALITHGANPGLVSHFVKRALIDLARDQGLADRRPTSRRQWGELARDLGVKVIHIAERDTQIAGHAKRVGEFVNTWSIDGFVGEGQQPAELGWGTHERHFPPDGNRHAAGSGSAIWLSRPGAGICVRSWTPLEGPYHGFLITHSEAISIADYLTVRDSDGIAAYRPTVHYAYHPCDDAVLSLHELAGKNWHVQPEKRLLMEEIVEGTDELGVLLMGHARGAYWYGSRLSIAEARELAPHNNATSLQVTVSVLAGIVWVLENPGRGIVEPDEVDSERILEICRPYLGHILGVYGDWTPLEGRGRLFPEDVDAEDPWQFKNFRVT